MLLDLSAPFDTVDHNILLTLLSDNVGPSGVPLTWFASYLSRRTQTVKTGIATSKPTGLTCGVPQGSVLGPILFTIYTAVELGKIIRKYGLEYHMCADDTQLYICFNTQDTACAIAKLEKCMDEIEKWMEQRQTGFGITGSTSLLKMLDISTIKVCDLDKPLCKKSQYGATSALCKSCDHQIHMIGKIVKFLTPRATKHLVHSFVTSRLDNCNSLLFGLPDKLIQHRAARLITSTKKNDHITPVMRSLHWLPVKSRIIFKILLQVYKSTHGLAPAYLSELIKPHAPESNLWSGMKNRLIEPRTPLVIFRKNLFLLSVIDPFIRLVPHYGTSCPLISLQVLLH